MKVRFKFDADLVIEGTNMEEEKRYGSTSLYSPKRQWNAPQNSVKYSSWRMRKPMMTLWTNTTVHKTFVQKDIAPSNNDILCLSLFWEVENAKVIPYTWDTLRQIIEQQFCLVRTMAGHLHTLLI